MKNPLRGKPRWMQVTAVILVIYVIAMGLAIAMDPSHAFQTTSRHTEEQKASDRQSPEQKPEKNDETKADETPLVTKPTKLSVFRVDYKVGMFGDMKSFDGGSDQYADWYATLDPEGHFSFDINGVAYTTTLSKGRTETHPFAGSDQQVNHLKLDGHDDLTVGGVLINAYQLSDMYLLEMMTQVDGKSTTYYFYLEEPLENPVSDE